MYYKRRELRRLWEIEVFDGDPEDPHVTTSKVTLIAWNAVDAIRHVGKKAAAQPVALHFVTWADRDNNIHRINSTQEGPAGDPVVPTISREEPAEADWK